MNLHLTIFEGLEQSLETSLVSTLKLKIKSGIREKIYDIYLFITDEKHQNKKQTIFHFQMFWLFMLACFNVKLTA